MRRISPQTLIAVVALLAALAAAPAWAQMGMGMGKRMMNLTPEKAAQVFDLRHQFMNDTAGLRKQMWVKRAEMAQLWKAEKPDEKAIVAKQKEMHALKGQMMEKAVAFRLKMKEIAPELGMFGPGCGMGPGRGMGPGGRGMGPGACFGPGGGPGFGPGPNLSAADDLNSNLEADAGMEVAMGPAWW
jgi:zinc resistance-associated protein